MSNDESKLKQHLEATPKIRAAAAELYDKLRESQKNIERFSKMTNAELANELLNGPWADTPIFDEFSHLLDEVMNRLVGQEGADDHGGK